MFWLISWALFGMITGLLAKWLHPGEDPVGFLPTIGIGVAGSFVGGAISWILNFGGGGFEFAGLAMSVVGGIIFLWAYRQYRLNRFFKMHSRMPSNILKDIKED